MTCVSCLSEISVSGMFIFDNALSYCMSYTGLEDSSPHFGGIESSFWWNRTPDSAVIESDLDSDSDVGTRGLGPSPQCPSLIPNESNFIKGFVSNLNNILQILAY